MRSPLVACAIDDRTTASATRFFAILPQLQVYDTWSPLIAMLLNVTDAAAATTATTAPPYSTIELTSSRLKTWSLNWCAASSPQVSPDIFLENLCLRSSWSTAVTCMDCLLYR